MTARTAVTVSPSDPRAGHLLATVLLNQGNRKAGAKEASRALAINEKAKAPLPENDKAELQRWVKEEAASRALAAERLDPWVRVL